MIHRIAIAASSLFLAVALLVNFRPPEAAGVAAITTASNNRVASAGGSTSTGTGASGSSGTSGTGSTGSGSTGSTGLGSTGTSGAPSPAPNSGRSTASGTFTGQDISMPYGDVQVQITVKNGRITAVTPLVMPQGGHSGRIASYAAPILQSEALQAQSANINIVSGATYTSEAYAMSLQSALDVAKI